HENALRPMAQQAIEASLGIKTHRERREMDALVLTVPKGQTAKLHPSAATQPMQQVWRGVMTGKKSTINELAGKLELFDMSHGRIVIDETGLTNTYDWELPYDKASDKVILQAIRDQLGLETLKEKRGVDVLIVEKADPR